MWVFFSPELLLLSCYWVWIPVGGKKEKRKWLNVHESARSFLRSNNCPCEERLIIERTAGKLQRSPWDVSHVERIRGLQDSPIINSGRPKREAGEKSGCFGCAWTLRATLFPTLPLPQSIYCTSALSGTEGGSCYFVLFLYVEGHFEPCFIHLPDPEFISRKGNQGDQ